MAYAKGNYDAILQAKVEEHLAWLAWFEAKENLEKVQEGS